MISLKRKMMQQEENEIQLALHLSAEEWSDN
jgi:hypothetical protein